MLENQSKAVNILGVYCRVRDWFDSHPAVMLVLMAVMLLVVCSMIQGKAKLGI